MGIVVKNLSYSLRNNLLIKDLSFEITNGSFGVVEGVSGIGKTTLLNFIAGLKVPQSGEIILNNKILSNDDEFVLPEKRNIGYVSQGIFLINDTIKENIHFGQKKKKLNEKRVYEVLKDVDLLNHTKNLKYKINSIVGEDGINLSGGQRQRLGLARALYNNPKLLILDEAFSALDTETEKKIIK